MRVELSAAHASAYALSERTPARMDEVGADANGKAAAVGLEPVRGDGLPFGRESKAVDEAATLTNPILDELADAINRHLHAMDKRLQFLVHEASGRVQMRVVDRQTNEVIREVPPEQVLELVVRIHDLIGLLVDEKA